MSLREGLEPWRTQMTDEPTDHVLVYMGHRELTGGKLGDAWVLQATLDQVALDEGELLARMVSVFSADRRQPVIGGVYRVRSRVDGDRVTTITSRKEYIGRLDIPLVGDWEAMDHAAETRHRTARAEVKVRSEPVLMKEVSWLRAHYQRLPWSDKAAFELLVLEMIRRRK